MEFCFKKGAGHEEEQIHRRTDHIQAVINHDVPPTLIDSQFAIYHLNGLRSIHGGLWLMAHPSGDTEVTFELAKAKESGLDAARAAFKAQLELETWRDDLPKRRKRLEKANSLKEMMDVVKADE